MSTCPDFGRLRSWLDHSEPELSRHIAGCARCGDAVSTLRDNAEIARDAIALLIEPQHPAPGRPAPATTPVPDAAEVVPPRRRTPVALVTRAAAVAVVAVLAGAIIGTPAGRSAAAAFLAQFRSESFAVVTVQPDEFAQGFEALERLGTIAGDFEIEPVAVDTLAEAEDVAGIAVTAPARSALPGGVDPEPSIHAVKARELRLRFDREKAPELPASFDGASLRVGVPAAVVLEYPSAGGGPGLVVAEAEQVTAEVEGGPTLDEVRRFLLESHELPPGVAAQLRAIDDWRSTFPLPVPADEVPWRDTTVGGAPAILFGDESGLGSAVLWQTGGRIHVVAGPLPAGEVRRLAEQR